MINYILEQRMNENYNIQNNFVLLQRIIKIKNNE